MGQLARLPKNRTKLMYVVPYSLTFFETVVQKVMETHSVKSAAI
jgi:hypothetical protein